MSKVAYPALCVPLCLRILRTCPRLPILHFVYHCVSGSFGHVQGCLSCTLCTMVQDPSDMSKVAYPALCVPWYRILRTCVRIVRILHFVYHCVSGSFGHVQGCLSCTLCTMVQDPSDMCKDSPDPALCVPLCLRILRTCPRLPILHFVYHGTGSFGHV